MPRRLVLHIGFYKTGSTALQDQLAHVRPVLERKGILYPRAGTPMPGNSSHSGLALQELHRVGSHVPYWYRNSPEFSAFKDGRAPAARDALAAEVAASDAETIVVSSEELVRFGSSEGVPVEQAKGMIQALAVDHVTVVCYVRRADRYLESWYNQLVKLAVPIPRLSVSMTTAPGADHLYFGTEHTDFDRMIDYWAVQVGCDELVVRDYDRLHNGAIFDDFSVAVGLPAIDNVDVPATRPNPRIDNNFIEYVRVWSLFRPRENHEALHRVLAEMAEQRHLPERFDVYVLDAAARRHLHSYATAVNERLGRLVGRNAGYFADLDEMLTVPTDAVSDVDAFRFWAPYIDVAVRARGIA
jgi:hypothetical protein